MFLYLVRNRFVKWSFLSVVLVSFLFLPFSVFAAPNDSMTNIQRTMVLNKPGVVFISTYYTTDLVIQSSAGYPVLAGKRYTTQTGGTGSGFVVSPDGYILTNGHVVNTPEKMLAWQAINMAAQAIVEDIVRIEFTNAYGYVPSDQEVQDLTPQVIQEVGGTQQLIYEFYNAYEAGEVKLDNINREVFVQQGAFVSGKKLPIEKGLRADVRAVDFDGFTEQGEVKGKDIAVLKVTASNMPTVLLGDSGDTRVGDKVYVIGYPGAPTFETFLSQESQLEATMTSGIISALKTMQDGSQVLQTDAALTHGNSGGPAFNENGEVIGIASMVSIEQGQQKYGFSYLRPSNVAQEFLNEKNIENVQGVTDEHYKKGIEYYENKKYNKAIKEFETVLRLYPNLIEAQDLIKKSQEAIAQNGSGFEIDINAIMAIAAILVIVLIVGGIILFKVIKKGKKMEEKAGELEKTPSEEKDAPK